MLTCAIAIRRAISSVAIGADAISCLPFNQFESIFLARIAFPWQQKCGGGRSAIQTTATLFARHCLTSIDGCRVAMPVPIAIYLTSSLVDAISIAVGR